MSSDKPQLERSRSGRRRKICRHLRRPALNPSCLPEKAPLHSPTGGMSVSDVRMLCGLTGDLGALLFSMLRLRCRIRRIVSKFSCILLDKPPGAIAVLYRGIRAIQKS